GLRQVAELGELARRGLRFLLVRRLAPRLVGEPPGERLVAAVAARHGRLRLAAGRIVRAADPDMEMLVVAVDRADLAEQRAVTAPGVAELLLDRRIDEDALDLRIARRLHDEACMGRRPAPGIDRQELVLAQHRGE